MKLGFNFHLHEYNLIHLNVKEEMLQNYTYYNFFNYPNFISNFNFNNLLLLIVIISMIKLTLLINALITIIMVSIFNFK